MTETVIRVEMIHGTPPQISGSDAILLFIFKLESNYSQHLNLFKLPLNCNLRRFSIQTRAFPESIVNLYRVARCPPSFRYLRSNKATTFLPQIQSCWLIVRAFQFLSLKLIDERFTCEHLCPGHDMSAEYFSVSIA